MIHFKTKIFVPTVVTSLLMEAAPAIAQLEEVIVTSRKRYETEVQVPATTAILTQELMDSYAIGDLKGVADKTPGLNFNSGPGSSGVLVSMRGIGTGTNNPGIDQSVALVADGLQLTQGLAFGAATFDLAQIEILKGPQALFFGKAAPAGVIAVKSADPGTELAVKLKVGYEFEGKEKLAEFIISGPVNDTLGLRLAIQSSDMDGYFKNESKPLNMPSLGSLGAAPVEKDFPNKESTLLRGTAVWDPTENLNMRLKLNYADVDIEGWGGEPQLVSCPEGTGSNFAALSGLDALGLSFIGGDDCKADDTYRFSAMNPDVYPGIYNDGMPFSEMKQYFGTLELTYAFNDDLSLNSVTGFYDLDHQTMFNVSDTADVGSPFAVQGDMQRSDFTQELRLVSDYSTALNFLAGVFYQNGETDYVSALPFNQTYAALIGQPTPPVATWTDYTLDTETYSFFGQLLWQINEALELGVGARWSHESRDLEAVERAQELFVTEFDAFQDALVAASTPGVPPRNVADIFPAVAIPIDLDNPELTSATWSPEVSLTWRPNYDLTVYGNLKQAYKSGSFDIGGQAVDGQDKSFDDERIRGGELGIKTRMRDNYLAFNASTYYYKYSDMQVERRVFDPSTNEFGVRTINAASSKIYGIDLDVAYAVPQVQGLIVSGAVNWNVAEYDEFDNAACYPSQLQSEGCNIDLYDANGNPGQDGVGDAQDLSGESLLRAPEWMANVGVDYERPVFNELTLRFGSIVTYSSSYSASSTHSPDADQKDYSKVSANVALIGADERWKAELIGDNLTDEYVFGNCGIAGFQDSLLFGSDQSFTQTGGTTPGLGGKAETTCFVERGRSVWIRLSLSLF